MNDEHTRTRFETLLLPLMNDAYNLTRWLMRNQEDAEDMVQESYLRAFRFFASFHYGTPSPLKIVTHRCQKPPAKGVPFELVSALPGTMKKPFSIKRRLRGEIVNGQSTN